MHADRVLNPADAAKKLGVSVKALRLYEQRGLLRPTRTAAGWRAYGSDQMKRAAEIVALRTLGLSLSQIAGVLDGNADGLEQALAIQQAALERQLRETADTVEKVRGLRSALSTGHTPTIEELLHVHPSSEDVIAAFDLPWPWGGERFEVRSVKPINYIVGPLFSGKTKLAHCLAAALPNAEFVGLDRLGDERGTVATLRPRIEEALEWLVEDGATRSDALMSLLARLESSGENTLIIDMVEQGLDEATQSALIAHLRRRGPYGRPLFLLTRSCAILDLPSVGPHEAIILCPANHSPPTFVAPHPFAPGYEAVTTCLATPEVRARSEGVIAFRPQPA